MDQHVYHYQAANLSFQETIDNFVVRNSAFEKVITDIKTTDKESSFQHYVFVGRRGSGKSTLLRRIEAEVYTNENLENHFECVNLGEEQSGIFKIYDIWDNVIRILRAKEYEIEDIDFRDYRDDLKAYTKKLHGQIIDAIRSKNKRLIILIDNIDRVLNNLGEDTDLLRELLMNFLDIRIIGGSTLMSEHFWKYEKPFYQFFSIVNLPPLSIEEIKELLIHWSEIKKLSEIKKVIKRNPGKLQSIRMLTDGTPRSMLIFVDMLLNKPSLKGYEYLKIIVDNSTPIYQERLGTLSPAQNKIITELAYFWEAVQVDRLIPVCKMEGKTISALLNQLYKLSYVEKIKGDTKNLYYRIGERFFNLWLIMTQGGPQQRSEAKYLTEFLEIWYDKNELNQFCGTFINEIKNNESEKNQLLSMSHALLNAKSIDRGSRLSLYAKLKDELQVPLNDLGDVEKYIEGISQDIINAFELEDYEKAINLLNLLNNDSGKKYSGLGLVYECLNEFSKAEKSYIDAIDKRNVDGMYNLARLYQNQGRTSEAEKYYLDAIENGDVDAMYNLALMYSEQGKEEEAKRYYLMAIDKGNIYAMNNLALMYIEQGKEEAAEKYFLDAKENGAVNAKYNLANLYFEQGKFEEAEKNYLLSLEGGVSESIDSLASLYYLKTNNTKALKDFIVSKKDQIDEELLCVCFLYLGELEQFSEYFNKLSSDENVDNISSIFIAHLLIHKQTQLTINLFNEYELLKDKFKPLYYIANQLLSPDQSIPVQTPPEIEESMNDILVEIKKQQERYYGTSNIKITS